MSYPQNDSWVYLSETGEVRYDLPKFRVKVIERKARNYTFMKQLYSESTQLLNMMGERTYKTQEALFKLKPRFEELKASNDELHGKHVTLIGMYNTTLSRNETLKENLEQYKKKLKKVRRERNWTIAGLIVTSVAIILKNS